MKEWKDLVKKKKTVVEEDGPLTKVIRHYIYTSIYKKIVGVY